MHPTLHAASARIRTSIPELCAQILLVFIVPIILINTGVLPIQHRVAILTVLVGLLFIVLIMEKWNFKMLGFGNVSRKAVLAYTLFTLAGVALIAVTGRHIGTPIEGSWWQYPHFLYLFFLVSATQEIAYRGYLMPALATFEKSPVALILTNAALFTFLHSIFPNYLMNLPLAFVGGIAFAWIYLKYPNTLLIILSHAVLNFAAVWYGFFTLAGGL
jgi:membrane protease YdiL (CAAX protease family)